MPTPVAITVAVGCAGGKHRAAMELGARLHATVTHRDLAKPVVNR